MPTVSIPGPPPPAPGSGDPRGPVRKGRVISGILLLLFLAAPSLLVMIGAVVGGTVSERTSPIAEGRAPGTLTFRSQDKPYVVALSAKPDGFFDGLTTSERRTKFRVRESDATEARCAVRQPDGSVKQIRGDRQTSNVVLGNSYATVGTFRGQPGTTVVACKFDPPKDLLGTVTEAPLMVHERSGLRTVMWASLVALLLFSGLGILQILRGTVWRKPRRA